MTTDPKLMTILKADDAIALERMCGEAALRLKERLLSEFSERSPLEVMWKMKVGSIGSDPVHSKPEPLNVIEQLNQTFTYIASCRAARKLLELHPKVPGLKLNLGTKGGWDIASMDGALIAEVFAAAHPRNNRKLSREIERIESLNFKFRYVFFMCPNIPEGRQVELERANGVQIWSVGEF